MSVPTTATYAGYYGLVFNETTGAYQILAGSYNPGTVTLGDDETDSIPEDGSAGDGTEVDEESLAVSIPAAPYNATETYSGWTIDGDPVTRDGAGDYYLYSNSATLEGTAGTAAPGTYVYCFLVGTHIATADGERPIEELLVGDQVMTAGGSSATVKWIGRMTLPVTPFNRNSVLPVLVRRGALGNGVPHRNLYVSADHALLIDGSLVHASALVNGSSIVRAVDVGEQVSYLHIETEEHEIILAEGAAAETFIDNVSREQFDNAAEYAALYPNAAPMQELDLPRVKFARQLPRAIAHRLDVAAGIKVAV